MKKRILFFLLFIQLKMMAQLPVEGEYYFRRQEMVAGLNFSKEGKFEFFFSYGAVDRSATGTFWVMGDTLKLKSDKEPGKDFTLKSQSREAKGYTLQFEDPNKYLIDDILCIFFVDGKQQVEYTDSNGKLHLAIPHCDSIYVQHPLFPDILTLVKNEKNNNNRFTLTLNPSLAQVSFKGIDFKIEGDKKITCLPNYFMMLDNIEFIKQ